MDIRVTLTDPSSQASLQGLELANGCRLLGLGLPDKIK